MKSTALVTGACGFVGSNLAKTALEKGFLVRATDLPSADRAPLKRLDVEFIPSDMTQKETSNGWLRGCNMSSIPPPCSATRRHGNF